MQGRVLHKLFMRQVHSDKDEVWHSLVNGAKRRSELGDFNCYPWGIDVFNATFESCSNKFKTKPEFYRYDGFPLALQIWLYKCCPELKGRFAEHNGFKVPHISQSSCVDGAPSDADLKKKLNDFQLHVDVKFGEILHAFGALTKKLEEKKTNECAYSGSVD
ncbi:hypothetical protein HAX54_046323 [Datura stramonium]|uniref:Uncharacterized protein n=1 Tax=Datura stramonium TaxID=4076 RepID=A0ABS8RPX1_DATST|nr:hypothetical protein [Datura stramonium]